MKSRAPEKLSDEDAQRLGLFYDEFTGTYLMTDQLLYNWLGVRLMPDGLFVSFDDPNFQEFKERCRGCGVPTVSKGRCLTAKSSDLRRVFGLARIMSFRFRDLIVFRLTKNGLYSLGVSFDAIEYQRSGRKQYTVYSWQLKSFLHILARYNQYGQSFALPHARVSA
jgi:hypothetical protein